MNDDVVGVHRLLGLRLRDHQRDRQGTVVGIDHTRRPPALLIRWAGNSGIEWVELTTDELDTLIAASERPKPSLSEKGDTNNEKKDTGNHRESRADESIDKTGSVDENHLDSFEEAEAAPMTASVGRG